MTTEMPQPDRRPLASYTWGRRRRKDDITRFRDVFQPDQGIFSPGYPLVPPEPERVRLWDFPVGVNTIYTPRAYEAIAFARAARAGREPRHHPAGDRDAQGPDRKARLDDQSARRAAARRPMQPARIRTADRVLAQARRRAAVRQLAARAARGCAGARCAGFRAAAQPRRRDHRARRRRRRDDQGADRRHRPAAAAAGAGLRAGHPRPAVAAA